MESAEYYAEIAAEINAGGAVGLYHYLLNYNCDGFDGAHTKPPVTEAKQILSRLCERTPEKFLRAWRSGEIPVNCMTIFSRQVYALYCVWCVETNEHPVTETRFGRILSKSFEKKRTNRGVIYHVLKHPDDMTEEDVSFFQEKFDGYRKSVIASKAR